MAGWKAISFADESRKKSLEQKFGVMEIPMMIVLDKQGNQLSENGIKDLNQYTSEALLQQWMSQSSAGQAAEEEEKKEDDDVGGAAQQQPDP